MKMAMHLIQTDLPLARAMHRGEITTAEPVHLQRADGSDIWVSLTAAPIRSEEGRLVGGVLVAQELESKKGD